MIGRLLLAAILLFALSAPALAQAAGKLISADRVTDAPAGMQAWRIRYSTADQDGHVHEVTGMVIAPPETPPANSPTAPRRVIAWTHGTWGVVEKCAPSLSPLFFSATPALADMIRRGYVVVAPDYPGLGSAMPHPFLLGVDTGRSVLDAVRAARGVPAAGAGSSFAVWGESQGGHAALWTAMIAGSYAKDLTLVGTAAAAPPTDLAGNLRSGSDANVRAMLTSFAVYSWSQRYGFPLSSLFNRTNQGVATRLARNNCITLGKNPRLGTILGVAAIRNALRKKDIGSIAPWSQVAKANSVDPRAAIGPLMIAQSEADPVVASSVTLAFARLRCRAGRQLHYVRLPGGDHANSARDSAATTLDWIAERFAGRPAASDCGSI